MENERRVQKAKFSYKKSKANWLIKHKDESTKVVVNPRTVRKKRLAECKKYRIFERRRVERLKDQATKGLRRMPWYMAPKKDVTSCEKLRGGANIL